MKKKILMIGTGGTIASKQTEAGLAPGLSSEDILSYIPQVESVCDVDTLQVCNIDSTNVTPEYWKKIAGQSRNTMRSMMDLSSVTVRTRWHTLRQHCLI